MFIHEFIHSVIHYRIDLVLFYTDVRRRPHANATLQLTPFPSILPSLALPIIGFPRPPTAPLPARILMLFPLFTDFLTASALCR